MPKVRYSQGPLCPRSAMPKAPIAKKVRYSQEARYSQGPLSPGSAIAKKVHYSQKIDSPNISESAFYDI